MLGSDLVRFFRVSTKVTGIHRENYQRFIGHTFDVVINANGNSKRFWANAHPVDDFFASTASVYKSLFDFKYSVYVYLSSSDVYLNHTKPQYAKEETAISADKLIPYGLNKSLAEVAVRTYAKKFFILRSSMILGSNLQKGPIYDILQKKPLFISKNSKLQMITTHEIANIIRFLLTQKKLNQIYNIGGKGTVLFSRIDKYMKFPIRVSPEAKKQIYEMSVTKLNKIYPLRRSVEYLQDYVQKYL